MHELWLEAGGGTDAYDVDRYVGLLREHGWAAERAGLVAVLRDAFTGQWPSLDVPADELEAFGRLLADELGKHGYRIHDITRCVRPKDDPLTFGRPMTPEEEATLVIPEQPRPRRRRS